jgi:phosphatidylglycerol:prolipoprotein diacylglycerol transferase
VSSKGQTKLFKIIAKLHLGHRFWCLKAEEGSPLLSDMFATYLHDLSPKIIQFTETIGIQWYGLAYVTGFYLTYLVMRFLARRGLSQIAEKDVGDFITGVALFGVILGGRLGYMLLYNFDEFIQRPWVFLMLHQGGMASHGGIAGVALYCLWYARKHRISWTGIGDTLVCGAPLGIFLGRIANFINGELFGRVTTVPWAMKFPTELLHEDFVKQGGELPPMPDYLQHSPDIIAWFEQHRGGRPELEAILHPRHPSQLYEAFGEGLLLTLVLLWIRVKWPKMPHGIISGLFFILYAVVRIALEGVRQPDSGSSMIMGLTKGQFFSTFMIAAGLAFILIGWLRREKAGSER